MQNIHSDRFPVTLTYYVLENELNNKSLIAALKFFFIESFEDEDGDIQITEGLSCNVWLSIDFEGKNIILHSGIDENELSKDVKDKYHDVELEYLANNLNNIYKFCQFYYNKERKLLRASYFIKYDEIIVLKQLVRLMRYFSASFNDAITKQTTDNEQESEKQNTERPASATIQ